MDSLVYRYDGSFPGLMCCVFEAIARKEHPAAILPPDGDATLYPEREIVTHPVRAARVLTAIPKKISPRALRLVQYGYLTCDPRRELLVVEFLRLGFEKGGRVTGLLQDDRVSDLLKAVGHLEREAHLLTGFVRFSIQGEVMAAVIAPKNMVLPLLAPHFRSRFPADSFLLYDKAHQMAYFYQNGREEFADVEELTLPPASPEEVAFRRMWKRYYDTVAIAQRENPVCRRTHMPKRYWNWLTEMQPENNS